MEADERGDVSRAKTICMYDPRKHTDNGTCIKRWGLRASSLSAVAKADAGQKHSSNHLTPNVLYMMLCAVFIFFFSKIVQLLCDYKNTPNLSILKL